MNLVLHQYRLPLTTVVACALFTFPARAAPFMDKIVAQYAFDQGASGHIASSVIDRVGGHTGMLSGDGLQLVDGVSGKAARFDGVGDYFRITPTSSFRTSRYAVSYWTRSSATQNTGNNEFVVSGSYQNNANSSGGGYDIAMTAGGQITTAQFTRPTGNFGRTTVDGLTTNDWHHVVAQWDGTQTKLYVDGTLASSTVGELPSEQPGGVRWADVPSDHAIYVGAYDGRRPADPFEGFYFSGDIDELTFLNDFLSDSEVAQLHNVYAVSAYETELGW